MSPGVTGSVIGAATGACGCISMNLAIIPMLVPIAGVIAAIEIYAIPLQSARFVKAKPGVYVLYDKNEDVIYIGESENLQNQFAKYVDTNFENDTCKQKTHTYQREFVENPKERRKQLLEDFKNKNGKLPLCNDVS